MAKAARRPRTDTAAWQRAHDAILQALDLTAEYTSLGVEFTGAAANRNGWAECYAVDREDRVPSAAVNISGAAPLLGRYKDSGGEQARTISFFDFAASHATGLPFASGDWKAARAHYAAKTGVALPSSEETRRPDDRLAFIPYSDVLADLWLRSQRGRGISHEALAAVGARLAKYPASAASPTVCIAVPGWGQHFADADPTSYTLWAQHGRTIPYFRRKGQPPEQKKMLNLGNGWIVCGNLAAADVVWKTEGPTDLLCLWSCVLQLAAADADFAAALTAGKLAAFTNSCGSNEYPSPEMLAHLAGKRVYLVHDADKPGEAGAEKWCYAIDLIASELRHVQLPYPISDDHGRDLRDWLHDDGHGYADLVDLARETPIWVAKAPHEANPPDAAPHESNGRHAPTTAAGDASNSPPIPPAIADPSAPGRSIEADDDPHRLARIYLNRFGSHADGLTLRFWRQQYWQWDGCRYREVESAQLKAQITHCIKQEFDRLTRLALATGGTSSEQEFLSKKIPRSLVHNVLGAIEGYCVLPSHIEFGSWLTPDPAAPAGHAHTLPLHERRNYIAMQNGLVDLDAMMVAEDWADSSAFLSPATPRWFSPNYLDYRFDTQATCPRWMSFLRRNLEGDEDRINLLQEWAGYCLFPGLLETKFAILEGEGANGKTVFIAAMEAMLGFENCSHVPVELFGVRFQLTPTLGKTLNVCGDAGELDKIAEGHIKAFTDGNPMFFDRKSISGIDAIPTAKLMLACNNRPRFSDRSDGIWRRVLLIPWLLKIPESERVKGMKTIEWWQRIGELPGIFIWAILGQTRLREQDGFTKPKVCEEALNDYREENNPAAAHLKETYVANAGEGLPCFDVYQRYKRWCDDSGYRAMGERMFGKELIRTFPKAKRVKAGTRSNRFWKYIGIGLRQEIEDDDEENEKKNLF